MGLLAPNFPHDHNYYYYGLLPADQLPFNRLYSEHHKVLLTQLEKHASRWRDLGARLGFTGELDNIQANPVLINNAPKSYLSTLLTQWLEWAPGDGRGSQGFATLEGLKDALRQANLGATAHDLHLDLASSCTT